MIKFYMPDNIKSKFDDARYSAIGGVPYDIRHYDWVQAKCCNLKNGYYLAYRLDVMIWYRLNEPHT